MEALVDRAGARLADELHEADVVLAAALGARPVARREGGRLVEEEQAGVATRWHRAARAAAAAELEATRDPASQLPLPAEDFVGIVQPPAVAVDQAALGRRDDLAERRDAILERHQIVRTILPSCSPASMRSCAARISSSGKTWSTTGRARPAATSS